MYPLLLLSVQDNAHCYIISYFITLPLVSIALEAFTKMSLEVGLRVVHACVYEHTCEVCIMLRRVDSVYSVVCVSVCEEGTLIMMYIHMKHTFSCTSMLCTESLIYLPSLSSLPPFYVHV